MERPAFYDTFTVVEVEQLTKSEDETVGAVFGMLGWSLKALPDFGVTAEPLGTIVDLSSAPSGHIRVGNKPKRTEEMCMAIQEFVRQPVKDLKWLAQLRGRILFARSLCYGCCAGCALRALNQHCAAAGASSSRRVAPELAREFDEALLLLARAVK